MSSSFSRHRVVRAALVGVCVALIAFPASTVWSHGGGFRGGGGGGMSRGGGGGMSRGGAAPRPSATPSRGGAGATPGRGGAGGGARPTTGSRPGQGTGPGATARPGTGAGRGPGTPGRGAPGAGVAPGRGGPGKAGPGGAGRFAGDPLAHTNLSADRLRSLGRGGSTQLKAQSIQSLDARGSQIRNNFYNSNWYGGRGWYANNFHAWWPGRWYGGWGGWGVGLATGLLWADLASWGGYGQAVAYDYGTTVVYSDDAVSVAGEEVGTPEEYAQGASDLAASGAGEDATNDDAEWRPLGVYALARDGETKPSTFLSLAVDANGVLRGNYYDAISDSDMQVAGKVDQKTQRAAWTIGDNTANVYEAGLSNLLKDQTQVLVHRNNEDGTTTGKVEQMLLVRVDEGDDKAAS